MLKIVANGATIGTLDQDRSGTLQLQYDLDWQSNPRAFPLSLSLPLSKPAHSGDVVRNYLQGLLPDNQAVLERWARQFQVSAQNPYALLHHVGTDVPGAAMYLPATETEVTLDSIEYEPWTEHKIANHLRNLTVDSAAWAAPQREGAFSLAGAQPKFALSWFDSQWHYPSGRAASTHIFKPGIEGLEKSALNEFLLMQVANRVGLPVAETEFLWFEDQAAIVVKRFDRIQGNGNIRRVHQEDFCQATGTPPANKYQNDGGPGYQVIHKLIQTHMNLADAREAGETLYQAAVFSWFTGATDAHAKNYALLYRRARPQLAPLYDIASAIPYLDHSEIRSMKLAMKVDAKYRIDELMPRHFIRLAELLGIKPTAGMDVIEQFAQSIPAGLASIAGEYERVDPVFISQWHDSISEHSRKLAMLL